VRIVVDLQGAQSTGSRRRGIGRYSLALAKAMAASAATHELWIALSGFYPDTIEPLRAEFDGLVPQRQIVLWQAPGPVARLEPSSQWRMETGELVREAFLASLRPDVLHLSSLFEGLTDDVVTSIGSFDSMLSTAVTLYDLIPLVHRDAYLADAMVESWYERKLGHLRRAQLCMAISESSRREAIDRLGLPDEWVVNISTAADAMFQPIAFAGTEQRAITERYQLTRPFLLYTGGIDRRKNIDGLIGAYARLPDTVRRLHQLAIVCSATDDQTARLKRLARQRGLGREEFVVAGFVPDHDLVALYNLCKAFVFPSWHEGFGLPALEAMSCGAAVIGADTSSVPEVIGRSDALFDPHDENAITAKLNEVLTDEAFRQKLRQHALPQAGQFSWRRTAHCALDAMQRLHRRDKAAGTLQLRAPPRRPRLAYVSPLPPERSGIADYSAELLPELARHYDIEVIVNQSEIDDSWIRANLPVRSAQWFDQNADSYDRVLYHFGNSAFHSHMFGLLERHPGVVVLHDFFLSGVLAHMERTQYGQGAWSKALFDSHGYRAASECFATRDPTELVFKYPANLAVLRQADGIIVHSEFSRELAGSWYGVGYGADWMVIPLLRGRRTTTSPKEAKLSLGFREDDFLVCSFGMMGPTKLNHRLLAAWLASPLASDERCHLVFVGEKDTGTYGAELAKAVSQSAFPKRIHFTAFALPGQYHRYLAATDLAVQLRALSRGETSAAVLDCMAHGLSTIVNAIGAAAELPADCVAGLPAEFTDDTLEALLTQLRSDPSGASKLGRRAAAHVLANNNPRATGDRYRVAIEQFARTGGRSRSPRLARRIVAVRALTPPTDKDWLKLAMCIAQNNAADRDRRRQWLLDISEAVPSGMKVETNVAAIATTLALMNSLPAAFRFEPVFLDENLGYRYARTTIAELLQVDSSAIVNSPIDLHPGDVFVAMGLALCSNPRARDAYESMRQRGVLLYFVVPEPSMSLYRDEQPRAVEKVGRASLGVLAELADGFVCSSAAAADELAVCIDAAKPPRRRTLKIGWSPEFAPGFDLPIDASRLAEIILEDRWHLTWHPLKGIAPWAATRAPNPNECRSVEPGARLTPI
jgi:glycosyltransferase involved in cell wall biosynthesis